MRKRLTAALGAGAAERVMRGLLLLTIFLLPFSKAWLLSYQHAYVAGTYNSFAVPTLYPQELLILATSLIWLFVRRPTLRQVWPFAGLGLIVAIGFASAFWSTYPLLAIVTSVHLDMTLALLLMLATELRDGRFAPAAIFTFIATVSLQAAWAIAQFLSNRDLGLHFLGESKLGPQLLNVAKVTGPHLTHIRSYGSLPHPNILAAYLTTAIFFLGTIVLWPYKRRDRWQYVYAALLTLCGIGLVFTFSRTAILVTLVNGALVVFYSWRRWKRLPVKAGLTAIVVFLVALLCFPYLSNRTALNTASETGIDNRKVGYEVAGHILTDQPFGVGAGNFVLSIDQLKENVPDYQHQPVHNAVLLPASELGIFAGFLLLAFIIRLGWIYHNVRTRDRRTATLNFSLFCLAGTFIAMGMADHFFWSLPQGLWLAAFLAAALISRIPEAKFESHHHLKKA